MAQLKARGVVSVAPGEEARLEDVLVDDPGPGEVRLRMLAAGVCHSDLHAINGGMGDAFPWLLGHEGCGEIESVGEAVDPARVGERVIVFWRAPCHDCRYCRRGLVELCASVKGPGPRLHRTSGEILTPVLRSGTFVTHTVVASGQAVPVAPDIPAEVACLIGCGVATGVGSAIHTAPVRPGDRVAVIGCGAVGLSVVQGARIAGAASIVAVDLNPRKLEWARKMGATATVDASQEDVVTRVRELSGGSGVDHCFDVVGIPATLIQAIECCDDAGSAMLVGVPPRDAQMTFPTGLLWNNRRSIRTSWYGNCFGPRDFTLLADWYRNGSLELDSMVSRKISLEQTAEAFAIMAKGDELRSVIVF